MHLVSLRALAPSLTRITVAGAVGAAMHIGQGNCDLVDAHAIEFHNRRGDFASWAEHSLQDTTLQAQFDAVAESKVKGEVLRRKLVTATKKRFDEVNSQVQNDTRLF